MKMIRFLACCLIGTSSCFAQTPSFDDILAKEDIAPLVVRIYSQVLSFRWPKGFTLGERMESNGAFTQEFRVVGESSDSWTQKVSISGFQNGAKNQKDPLLQSATQFKQVFKARCPKHYSVTDVGTMNLQTGQPAFVYMLGCGITRPVENSEKSKLLLMAVVMQGTHDVYTLTWIERSETDHVPPTSWPVWRARLDSLLPIQIY